MDDLENMKKFQNMAKEYQCENCSKLLEAPMHCNHPMHIENAHWICWMGSECGDKMVESCCDSSKLIAIEN